MEEPGRNLNGVMVLSDWPYSDGALAATVVTVNAKTHEIVDADVAFNAEPSSGSSTRRARATAGW